eukprot:698287-Amphidinium_carterae.1
MDELMRAAGTDDEDEDGVEVVPTDRSKITGRKRQHSTGGVTKADLLQMTETLSNRMQQQLTLFKDDLKQESIKMHDELEEVRAVASAAATKTDRVASDLEELRKQIRDLTPPATPREAHHAESASSSSGTTAVNPRRLVVSGWDQVTHRAKIIKQINDILATAGEELTHLLTGYEVVAPKVMGKVGLRDVKPPATAAQLHPLLVPLFQQHSLKIKRDRTLLERQRTGQLVALARAVDEMKGQTERAEICWSDGIVYWQQQMVGKFVRAEQKWTWSAHPPLTEEEMEKAKAAVAQHRG